MGLFTGNVALTVDGMNDSKMIKEQLINGFVDGIG